MIISTLTQYNQTDILLNKNKITGKLVLIIVKECKRLINSSFQCNAVLTNQEKATILPYYIKAITKIPINNV